MLEIFGWWIGGFFASIFLVFPFVLWHHTDKFLIDGVSDL